MNLQIVALPIFFIRQLFLHNADMCVSPGSSAESTIPQEENYVPW